MFNRYKKIELTKKVNVENTVGQSDRDSSLNNDDNFVNIIKIFNFEILYLQNIIYSIFFLLYNILFVHLNLENENGKIFEFIEKNKKINLIKKIYNDKELLKALFNDINNFIIHSMTDYKFIEKYF